jgi:hypothetical protein
MGGWGRKEACIGFRCENLRERDHWGDQGVDEKILLIWIFRKWDVGIMDWIGLGQDRDRWEVIVDGVMSLRV